MTPPHGWPAALAEHLGAEPWRLVLVAVTAVGIYLVFLLLVRVFGVRVLTGWNGFDAVVIIMFGAVAGRVIVGNPPTLATGVVGLGTLMAMEMVFGTLQSATGLRSLKHRATVIMVRGEVVPAHLRRTHLTEDEVFTALRRAGVARADQVQCVVLEATGGLSILRTGQEIDPAILRGVRGAELVLDGGRGTELR